MGSYSNLYHPAYAFAVVALVALVAWPASYVSRFYRTALAIEDRTRITPLDGLRGLLCFAVMIHHASVTYVYIETGYWAESASALYNLLGQTSVALFFCITAFLFWGRAVARDGAIDPKSFLMSRLFRIAPLYVFSCLVAVAVLSPYIHWLSPSSIVGLLRIGLLGLRKWNGFGPPGANTINAQVTWTLQYEWGFYLVLPALALMVKTGKSRLLLFGAGLLVIFGVGPASFFVPGVLAVYASRNERLVAWLRHPATTVGVLLACVVLPLVTSQGFNIPALVLTTIIFIPIACGNTVFGLLNLRSLRLMGLVSYSVYLLHGVCLYVIRPWLVAVKANQPVWFFWAYIAACAVGVLMVSMITYRWVEWPFIVAEKRLRTTPQTSALIANDRDEQEPGRWEVGEGSSYPETSADGRDAVYKGVGVKPE